ncbi:MAG: HNH endonuclease [Candidatus Dormibacteria bacterium]
MGEPLEDAQIRQAAFAFLSAPARVGRERLFTSAELRQGFTIGGQRVPLCSQQGIFKPKVMTYAPLSIRSSFSLAGAARPYEDEFDQDGHLSYQYRRDEKGRHENRWLLRAMEDRLPLVFLDGEGHALYRAYFPVYIVGDDHRSQSFLVDLEPGMVEPADDRQDWSPPNRAYRLRLTAERIHQRRFRSLVLEAYRTTCTVCCLRHRELLDAAHIVPDSIEAGVATVPNALSLCKLHHAAFDHYLIGIRPDLTIEVREDVLHESDGPMLVHGLQEVHRRRLMSIPRREDLRPDPEFLDERYRAFRARVA